MTDPKTRVDDDSTKSAAGRCQAGADAVKTKTPNRPDWYLKARDRLDRKRTATLLTIAAIIVVVCFALQLWAKSTDQDATGLLNALGALAIAIGGCVGAGNHDREHYDAKVEWAFVAAGGMFVAGAATAAFFVGI